MNHIEGYQTKIKAQKCKDNYTCKPYRLVEINFLMDCPHEYYKTRKVKTK